MSAVPFPELPDDARLWVFPSPGPLEPEAAERLLAEVDRFLEGWHAHGRPVVGGREWRHGQFLLVGADERATGVSGCSIDSLFRALQGLEREMRISLTDAFPVWFRGGDGEIRSVPRPEFRALAEAGEVDADTVVFNHTVGTVGEVRAGRWEGPLRESWHAKAFPVAAR